MKKLILSLFSVFFIFSAQNVISQQVGINNTGAPPFSGAMLDISSTSKGLLIPRMNSTSRLGISPLTEGMLVYQTDGDYGFYFFNGGSWAKISTHTPLWIDQGNYLEPVSPISNVRIADDSTYTYGVRALVNTGINSGYGAYFRHTSSDDNSIGLYSAANYTGVDNSAFTIGASIKSNSTTQDQYGIHQYTHHTGTSGYTTGIYNGTEVDAGNIFEVVGFHNYCVRDGNESYNHGIYSYAEGGTDVYSFYGVAQSGNNTFGVYGNGKTFGGVFTNGTSGYTVKLGGLTFPIQITDGSQGTGKVLTSDMNGFGTWQSLPPGLWTDNGDYLSPTSVTGEEIKVADTPSRLYGFYANMNTGSEGGIGGYFSHTSTAATNTGVHAAASYIGSGTTGATRGAVIESNSTTQDQTGIYNQCIHTGISGDLYGMYSYTDMQNDNPNDIYGINNISTRLTDAAANYGIYSLAENGTIAYGLYAEATAGAENYGVYGEGSDWGGWFEHSSSGNMIKLGGSSVAIETNGDIKLGSLGDALMIGSNDVVHLIHNDITNIAVGVNTGQGTTEPHNSFFGYEAGLSTTSAWDNTFVGYKSGRAVAGGDQNTFLGSWAGSSQVDGINNTYLGYHTGGSCSSSSENTYVGAWSGNNNIYGSGNVFLGYSAGSNETGSNKLYVHNSNNSNPLIYGEFDNGIVKLNGRLGLFTVPSDTSALHVDYSDKYAGYFSSDYGTTSTHVIHAVYDGTSVIDARAIYGESTPGSDNNYGIGGEFHGNYYAVNAICSPGTATNAAYAVRAINEGSAGTKYGVYGSASTIPAESYAIYCAGNGVYTGSWTHTSDRKLKKYIENIKGALGLIMQLTPSSYEFRQDEYDFINLAGGRHYGFIAQELELVMPELVGSARQPVSDVKNAPMFEFKTTNTIELIPVLTKAIQEQQAMIEEQQHMISQLQREVDELTQQINQ